MCFWKKKQRSEMKKEVVLKVDEIFLATTYIISSYNDGTGCGPKEVKWYLLVTEQNGEYYEIFSDKKIQKELDTHKDGIVCANFDTPYIIQTAPLREYLQDENQKDIKLQLLFDFITLMNVQATLKSSE